MYDIAIIGGGPAGMTAALYAKRAGLSVVIFESDFFGGQIINSHKVDNYPGLPGISGYELSEKLFSHIKEFDVDIINKKVVSCELTGDEKIINTRKESYSSKAVVIATGVKPRKLGLLNEEIYTGNGISYCATCDGAFYKDKIVAVNGGGNTALDDVLYLSKFAQKIYLIHRRDRFRGDEITLEKIKSDEKVEIIIGSEVRELKGDGKLSSIVLNNEREIDVDGLFLAIGNKPETELFKGQVELDSYGYIITDKKLKTNLNLVYAAGDVIVKQLRQVVTAQNDGAVAISSILEEL